MPDPGESENLEDGAVCGAHGDEVQRGAWPPPTGWTGQLLGMAERAVFRGDRGDYWRFILLLVLAVGIVVLFMYLP